MFGLFTKKNVETPKVEIKEEPKVETPKEDFSYEISKPKNYDEIVKKYILDKLLDDPSNWTSVSLDNPYDHDKNKVIFKKDLPNRKCIQIEVETEIKNGKFEIGDVRFNGNTSEYNTIRKSYSFSNDLEVKRFMFPIYKTLCDVQLEKINQKNSTEFEKISELFGENPNVAKRKDKLDKLHDI